MYGCCIQLSNINFNKLKHFNEEAFQTSMSMFTLKEKYMRNNTFNCFSSDTISGHKKSTIIVKVPEKNLY